MRRYSLSYVLLCNVTLPLTHSRSKIQFPPHNLIWDAIMTHWWVIEWKFVPCRCGSDVFCSLKLDQKIPYRLHLAFLGFHLSGRGQSQWRKSDYTGVTILESSLVSSLVNRSESYFPLFSIKSPDMWMKPWSHCEPFIPGYISAEYHWMTPFDAWRIKTITWQTPVVIPYLQNQQYNIMIATLSH